MSSFVIKHEYEPTVETGGGWVGLMTTSPNIFLLIFANSFKPLVTIKKILLQIVLIFVIEACQHIFWENINKKLFAVLKT